MSLCGRSAGESRSGGDVLSSAYLRPLGLLSGSIAGKAVAEGAASWLAGGPLAFTAAELIDGREGRPRARFVSAAELLAIADPNIACLRENAATRRGAFAGLVLDRPHVMGIVNITPDSFSDGGLYDNTDEGVTHAASLAQEGADILDIGGESTRPGADPLPSESELERLAPVLKQLRGVRARLSVDTRKADVMRAAAGLGAHILNDISALSHDPDSLAVAAQSGCGVVLMHAQGDPRTMQLKPAYDDVVLDVYDYLRQRIEAAMAAGIRKDRIVADPGIGFGKTHEHNLTLLSELTTFHALGVGLLVGASRKQFIGTLSDEADPRRRDAGSHAAALAAVAQGAQIIRVHDVRGTRQALGVWTAVASHQNALSRVLM